MHIFVVVVAAAVLIVVAGYMGIPVLFLDSSPRNNFNNLHSKDNNNMVNEIDLEEL
jgi:hypothetical protein